MTGTETRKKKDDGFIAFTDLETTGLKKFNYFWSPRGELTPWNEICEIGLVLVRQSDLSVVEIYDEKVKIQFPNKVSGEARDKNGFDEKDWQGARELREVLKRYSELTRDAVFAAYNASFDWGFLEIAFATQEIIPQLIGPPLDVLSYAKGVLNSRGHALESYRLDSVARFLGLPEEPLPHRAIGGANLVYEIYKALQTFDPASKSTTHPVKTCQGLPPK